MLKKYAVVVLMLAALFAGCTPEHSKLVVAEYDDSQILMDEFEKAYANNVGSVEKAKDDSQEMYSKFLDLYVNFKMKLRDAWVRGYYDDPAINAEIDAYQKKIGGTYIKEKLVVEKGLRKLYDERKYEYRVSHILLRESPQVQAKKPYEVAKELIEKIKNGESFETLCVDYSADQFSKMNGGDVYWLTAGQIGYSWDKAMTSTPVGEIYPEPVKTRFGYHVIKVTDKKERVPEIKARHILISFRTPDGKVDTAKALARAQEVRQKLLDGGDFAKLAEEYSDDKGSAAKGGDLGFFKRRMMVKEFDETAFNLNVGEISDIVKTRFGFHIIQVTDKKPYPPYDVEKTSLRKIYDAQRFPEDFKKYTDKLKDELKYQPNSRIFAYVAAIKDSSKFNSQIVHTPFYEAIKDSVVFTIENQPYTADSMLVFAAHQKDLRNQFVDENKFARALEKFAQEMLVAHQAMRITGSDPEFKKLMDDYRNGIYIFKLQESEVWDKINVDSVEVQKYYEANKDNYTLPDRVEFYEIFTRNDSLINKYYDEVKQGGNFEEMAKQYSERKSTKATDGFFKLIEVSSSTMAKHAWELQNPGDVSEPFKAGNGWSIVKLVRKEPARNKTFEEAKAEVISDYQEYLSKRLEEEYINKLKERYDPVYYYDVLKQAYKK